MEWQRNSSVGRRSKIWESRLSIRLIRYLYFNLQGDLGSISRSSLLSVLLWIGQIVISSDLLRVLEHYGIYGSDSACVFGLHSSLHSCSYFISHFGLEIAFSTCKGMMGMLGMFGMIDDLLEDRISLTFTDDPSAQLLEHRYCINYFSEFSWVTQYVWEDGGDRELTEDRGSFAMISPLVPTCCTLSIFQQISKIICPSSMLPNPQFVLICSMLMARELWTMNFFILLRCMIFKQQGMTKV